MSKVMRSWMKVLFLMIFALSAKAWSAETGDDLYKKASKFSNKEVSRLEKKAAADPNDVHTRLELLFYYANNELKSKAAREAHEKLAIWFIENHPDEKALESFGLNLSPKSTYYDKAKDLWSEHLDQHPKDTQILFNAAHFFTFSDPKMSEELLKKGMSLEPKDFRWYQGLGMLYSVGHWKKEDHSKEELDKKTTEVYEKALSLCPDAKDRIHILTTLSRIAIQKKDFSKAKVHAENALKELDASKDIDATDRKYILDSTNEVLGQVALSEGDLRKADEYLVAIGKTARLNTSEYMFLDTDLAEGLFAKGHKEVVVRYLEECSTKGKKEKALLKKWLSLARKGEKPNFNEQYDLLFDEAPTPAKWSDIKESVHWVSLPDAEGLFKKKDKPILYDFSAEWCGPCKRLRKDVFGDKKIAAWIDAHVIPVMVLDRKQEEGKNPPNIAELQKKYKVEGFPTLVLQFPDGHFKTDVGFANKEETWEFLNSQWAEFKKTVE